MKKNYFIRKNDFCTFDEILKKTMSKKSFCRSITYRYLDLKRTKTETSYISDISYQIYNINLFTILMQCCIFIQSRQFYQVRKSKKV